jgi:hypothetical protein
MEGRTAPILHTVEPGQKLDEKPEDAPRGAKSPHDTLQEFLNASDEHDWAIVTNGLTLRVLRDFYHTYTRGYVEFDLENMFTSRNYGDFRALYRLCHATRFIKPIVADNENDIENPLEQLYQVALSTGVKVGQDLQTNVVSSIETLGNGFLNSEIKADLKEGNQEAAEDYYQDLLYVVYRVLFLMFTEQRGMMSNRDSLFTEEYSITKLRERAEQREKGDRNTDLWEGLKSTFELVGKGDENLAVPGYNGDLFNDGNLKYILRATCPNEKILSAIDDLTHIEQDGYRQRISYSDLGVEEIGAVYESLLEFTPQLAETTIELEDRTISQGSFYLDDRGMERKGTGSYYTDPELINELIKNNVEPIVETRVDKNASTETQEQQLLNITVCDPACGSGAFLIAANNYLAKRLAEIRSDSLYPNEQIIRQSRRSVVQHCLYGVDKNPMAVELAKVSLWINSAVENKPLSFLDHRIKHGNSLIGTTPELISEGVPDGAFETSQGRDCHPGTELRRIVRNESKKLQTELNWFDSEQSEYISISEKLEDIDETDIQKINEKEKIYKQIRENKDFRREKLAHDVWTAAFYWPIEEYQAKIENSNLNEEEYIKKNEDEFPTPKSIEKIRRNLPSIIDSSKSDSQGIQSLKIKAEEIAEEEDFFHWYLEFPKIFFKQGGFDCLLGNPPWDKIEIEEREFFAVSAPEVASKDTKSKRRELISELKDTDPDLYEKYQQKVRQIQSRTRFAKESGRFKLTGKGHLNTYALFAELGLNYINDTGRTGIIVPTGIITDYYTQDYFQKIVDDGHLTSLFDFENNKIFFPDIHSSFKFSLLSLGGKNVPVEEFELGFYLTNLSQLHQEERRFSLTPEEIELLNPNTKNCPTFKTRQDANQTVKIYDDIGVLKNEVDDKNPWDIKLKRMFNRSDDSHLFETLKGLKEKGAESQNGTFSIEEIEYLPLYESKYIHQFDYRYSTYEDVSEDRITGDNPQIIKPSSKSIKNRVVPKFWLERSDYQSKWTDDWHFVLRMVTNATNERTVISSIIPGYPTVNSLNHIIGCSASDSLLLLASLNSFVLDYAARQKLGGENLNQYIIKQLPIPSPDRFENIYFGTDPATKVVQDHTIKLVYSGTELRPFAEEAGYNCKPYEFTMPGGKERQDLRYELEAIMWKIYGLDEGDFESIFETFEQIKSNDLEKHGYYYTREKIKEKFLNLQ